MEFWLWIAIIALFFICIIISCSTLPYDRLIEQCKDDRDKLNLLYKSYYKPMAEEYAKLKDYSSTMVLYNDSVTFIDPSVDARYYNNHLETIKYLELEQKLTQLKADMELGCKKLCKKKK